MNICGKALEVMSFSKPEQAMEQGDMGIFNALFGKKEDPPINMGDAVRPNIETTLDPEQLAEEEAANKRANAYMRETVTRCGYVKAGKLNEFFAMSDVFFSVEFHHINVEAHLNSGDALDIAEKKAFGLNTRKKYARWLIELFEPSAFSKVDPKKWINDVSMAAWHKAHREKNLARFKKIGIQHVKVLDCGDERDCKHAALLAKKSYLIDAAPELPHAKCDSAYCRCFYVPDTKV